jgi:hypothetical protein
VSYETFLSRKLATHAPSGFEPTELGAQLFPFQQDLVRWACRRGKAAIFAATGLGKTRMQLEWAGQVADQTQGQVLILAPLAVAQQTVAESERIGRPAVLSRTREDIPESARIVVTNYERLHRFDPSVFAGVVLDESSCIKHYTSKTLKDLIDAFGRTPYRLCATATPAPNDYTELGTHSEFLGIGSRAEMLAEFFTHDGGETQLWRLKGHARPVFWRWVASWGALVTTPADLGHDDSGYVLPPLHVKQSTVADEEGSALGSGYLFAPEAQTLTERRQARRASLEARVDACAKRVNEDRQPWVVWCDLNAEADALCDAIPDAVEVRGTDDIDVKESRLRDFSEGRIRVLVTKPSIAGHGLNWQHCARMAFVGLSDSWENYFQAIRRCWRFGQKRPVEVHVFASEMEGAVVKNLQRKAVDAEAMARELSAETALVVRESVGSASRWKNTTATGGIVTPEWLITRGA